MRTETRSTPLERHPNRLWLFFTGRSERWVVTMIALIGLGVVGVALLRTTFRSAPAPPVVVPGENRQLALYTDTEHPLAFLGSDYAAFNDADGSTKLSMLYRGLEQFDGWLAPRLDEAIAKSLAKEALRMQQAALKESASGDFDTHDALNLFDFAGCLAALPGDRCVLLRYAGEGIAQFAQASEQGDVYGQSAGYLRMRAALLALGDFQISSNAKREVPLHALANYRHALYTALKYSPAAIAEVEVALPNAVGGDSPAEALERAYPQTRSTMPVDL